MRTHVWFTLALALAGCGDNTTSGSVDASAGAYESIQFSTSPVGFDDLQFAPDLGKVVAVPFGDLYLVDPVTNAFTHVAVPSGCATGDAKGTTVYLGDRQNITIVIVDAVTGAVTGTAPVQGFPDYVRASPTTNEVWVSLPGINRIDYYTINAGSPVTLTRAGAIAIGGDAEGLEFDGAGHAYTNSNGTIVQIEVASHAIVNRWPDGCTGSHGFPQSDTAFGLVFGGCATDGGAGIVSSTTGAQLAMTKTDGGDAILAFDPTLHHFYLRGDGGPTLAIYGVSPAGSLTMLTTITIPSVGHGATADRKGHLWVCDPEHGGIIKVNDSFPASS